MKPITRLVVTAMLIALFSTKLFAGTAASATALKTIQFEPSQLKIVGSGASKTATKVVDVAGQTFAKAMRVSVKEKVGADYNAQFRVPLADDALVPGDVILVRAWAHMIDTADESAHGQLDLVLEQAKDPYDKVFASTFGVSKEWQRFDVPAAITRDFSKTGLQFNIRVGAFVQTLEIGGVELQKFPAGTELISLPRTEVTYDGREASAPWRKAALERIEKIRKAPITVTVVDAAGKPVPNASVRILETRQSFVFGSCYSPPLILDRTSPDAEKYRKTFLELFNTGVDEYAMKWPGWIDPPTKQEALDSLQWMLDHHIAVRGHNMVWPGWKRMPDEVKAAANDKDALRSMIREHIKSVGGAMRGKVIDWDVVNEPYVNNDLLKSLGEDAMADWFKTAREADPTAKLYLNETSVPTSPPADEHYTALFDRVKHLKELGGPIDGVGMQAHFGQNVQPPLKLLGIYDRFEKLGLPVRITELDIDTNDEQLQADYLRDFLIASYSHPNINGILIWGFWSGAHWRPDAAMFRKDWSPRPMAAVWKDLVLKEWRTDVAAMTDASGAVEARAFFGDYEVTATLGSRKATVNATLSRHGQQLQVALPN